MVQQGRRCIPRVVCRAPQIPNAAGTACACPPGTVGVEPELYCQVRYLDWTGTGHLRGACFQRLLEGATPDAEPPPAP